MRTRHRTFLYLAGLLGGAATFVGVPLAAQTSTATSYPPECSAARLKPAAVADTTRKRCALDRAHVDVVRATAPVKSASTALGKAQATYRAAAAKLATATAAESLARVAYAAALTPPAPVDTTPAPPPIVVVVPPPVVTPIDSAPPVASGPATLAELPRSEPVTAYPTTPLRQVRVPAGASLQAAINAASGDTELLVAPDATYVCNCTLPNKGPAQSWIVIRTDTALSTTGRMTPSAAGALHLAKILSPTYGPAIGTDPGAHHYRITGVEIGTTPAAEGPGVNMLVRFGDAGSNGQRTLASVPHHLILDRAYVHGTPTLEIKRGVTLNCADCAAIDSWVSEIHARNGDAQAVLGYNGTAGALVENNHLEASHEVVAFGGDDPADSTMIPRDVTVRGNHITRPQAWKGKWQVKVLLETKDVHRLLVEGNVFENTWEDAQPFAVNLKSENQSNTAPWSQTADVTLRRNRFTCLSGWLSLSGKGSSSHPNIRAARITITDNLVEQFNVAPCTGSGNVVQLVSGVEDVVLAHNTILNLSGTNTLVTMGGTSNTDLTSAIRFSMHSNVAYHGSYGLKGPGLGVGNASITGTLPGALFGANLLIGGSCSSYPATTVCATSVPPTLPLGFDGRAAGADLAAVARATANAVVAP